MDPPPLKNVAAFHHFIIFAGQNDEMTSHFIIFHQNDGQNDEMTSHFIKMMVKMMK